ncbi:MAG: purine/pyrimidine permease [Deltaproteobacteria bacterium]|nr:purine/pyrimidine permease [Deltaproteobacteria bacterium]
MKLDYDIDQKVPFLKSLLLGIQWAAIIISTIVILGKVIGNIYFINIHDQALYFQKLLFLSAVTLSIQIFWGHRLPLVPGPAAILIIGIISSQGYDTSVIYTSITIGGLFYTVLSITGLFSYFQRFFTSNVVAVVLLLITFTLAPNIQELMTDSGAGIKPLYNLSFSFSLLFMMFIAYRLLKGIWKATMIVWGIIMGSLFYYLIFPSYSFIAQGTDIPMVRGFLQQMNYNPSLKAGVLISFLLCYLALFVNDLGSIKSVIELLEVSEINKRIRRGLMFTGLSNIASGFFGVIGPVNYSLSPGLIMSTKCASRFTLVPAFIIMLILSFCPYFTSFLGSVPPSVTGAILAYVLASQVAAGLIVAFKGSNNEIFDLNNGIIIGLSILLGTIIAFMPADIINQMPVFLRPVLGNGFVMGTLSAMIFENIIFKGEKSN